MEKAVVDFAFKSECLASGTPEQRKAATNAASAVKDDTNWEQLYTVVGLLEPLKLALDNAQSNGRRLGKVRSVMFRLSSHFSSFSYPPSTVGTSLKQHVMNSFNERERYTLRAVHSLAYLLDPRYADHPSPPDTTELSEALNLLCSLAAAHDVKLELTHHKVKDEKDLPPGCASTTADNIMAELTAYKAKSQGALVLPAVWEQGAVKDPLAWWKQWGSCIPNLQTVAVKIMKLPVGFGAGERSFSNAAKIQSKLRTRLSYSRLHKLLFVYCNSRSLSAIPSGMGLGPETAPLFGPEGVQLDGVARQEDVEDDDEMSAADIFDVGMSDGLNDADGGSSEQSPDDVTVRVTQESISL